MTSFLAKLFIINGKKVCLNEEKNKNHLCIYLNRLFLLNMYM